MDVEFNHFDIEQLNEIDTLVFGRVTYEGFASFWHTAAALENDPVVARLINGVSKIVASRYDDLGGMFLRYALAGAIVKGRDE